MVRERGQCRHFLEMLKKAAAQVDWSLEQMADFWDSYIRIQHEHPKEESVLQKIGVDGWELPPHAVPEPERKQ